MANIGEVFGAASAIVKGMGVTLKEMMSPTVTENYPDEPAKLQERFRGVHELQRDENGMEKCVACFLAPRPAPPTASISRRRRTPSNSASAAASVTPRSTTSITTA